MESLLKDCPDEIVIFESIKAIAGRMADLLKSVGLPVKDADESLGETLNRVSHISQKAHPGLAIHLDISDKFVRDESLRGLRLLPTVIDNLFRNAAQHAGANVILDVSIWRDGDTICLEISDSGSGIQEEIRSNLFQRGASTTGGGLGLYLSSTIIKAYNGSIRLQESDTESGSCFLIEIPL